MNGLHDFQPSVWQAIWANPADAGTEQAPWAHEPGFAVYRNTVLRGCVDALVALYPAVHRLTGDDWFRAQALRHIRVHPPRDACLATYGAELPDLLAQALPQDQWPWLPEVARLDQLWAESLVASDAPSLSAEALVPLAGADLRWRPHPATRWHWHRQWPLWHLWRAAREGWPDPNPPRWRGEGVLFTRPGHEVLATPIGPGAAALLCACATGTTLPEAVAAALAAEPGLDLTACMGLLLAQGAFHANPTETTP